MTKTENRKHICPVGYVIDAPKLDGKGHEECRGTRHFKPGEKIYILPMHSYDIAHHERAEAAGKHRNDGKFALVWIDLRRLEKFDVDQVKDSDLTKIFKNKLECSTAESWTASEAREFANWRNQLEVPDWGEKNKKNIFKK